MSQKSRTLESRSNEHRSTGTRWLMLIIINLLYYNIVQVMSQLLTNPSVRGMLVDVGMPVMHRNVTYNCRVVFYNGQIVMIRPKVLFLVLY